MTWRGNFVNKKYQNMFTNMIESYIQMHYICGGFFSCRYIFFFNLKFSFSLVVSYFPLCWWALKLPIKSNWTINESILRRFRDTITLRTRITKMKENIIAHMLRWLICQFKKNRTERKTGDWNPTPLHCHRILILILYNYLHISFLSQGVKGIKQEMN